jgi:hypothetical protein
MGLLSNKLRSIEGGSVSFWCPGCNDPHAVGVGAGAGPRWGYNGNPDAPTFTPSVLVRSGHYVPGGAAERGACWCTYNAEHPDDPDPFRCTCCHSFVTDGRIQFLSDCTHALAGQTVELPDWPQP